LILRFLLGLLLVWGGSGCSPFQQGSSPESSEAFQIIPQVPYRAQQARNDCGAAALASLLAFRGKEIPVEDIARDVYTPALGGSLPADLENFAGRQGFEPRSGRGDLKLLRSQIAAGRPVIVLIDNGVWAATRPHYIVVFGFDEHRFLVHSGTEKNVMIDAQKLLSRWRKMNRLYLYLQ